MARGRKPNDGRGKTGGRVAGTPNKEKPLKALLREHSLNYYTPSIPAEEVDFNNEAKKAEFIRRNQGKIFSQYELDLMDMKPSERAKIESELLQFHTPKQQAVSADMLVANSNKTFSDRLARLSAGEDIPSDED